MDADVVVAVVLVFISNNSIGKIFFQIIFTIPLKLPPRLVLALLVLDQEKLDVYLLDLMAEGLTSQS